MQEVPNFDIEERPFIFLRDQWGLFVIDIKQRKIEKLDNLRSLEIEENINLFGHG